MNQSCNKAPLVPCGLSLYASKSSVYVFAPLKQIVLMLISAILSSKNIDKHRLYNKSKLYSFMLYF